MVDGLFFSGVSPARQEARAARDPVRAVGAPAPVGPDGARQQPQSAEQLNQALRSVREHIQNTQRTLQFSVDEASGSTVVKVIDSDTNEVIRQIPSEEMLVIASRLEAATKGVLLSEQA